MRTTQIWTLSIDEDRDPAPGSHSVALGRGGIVDEGAPESTLLDAVQLMTMRPSRDACGVVIVPDACDGRARLNGVRLPAGLHRAEHGSCVAVGPYRAWFAVAVEPDRIHYDPDVHGDTLYCLRTKARLEPGDEIVICPGSPDVDCGMKFKSSAWSDTQACHHCGTLPSATGWTPTPPDDAKTFAALLALAEGA